MPTKTVSTNAVLTVTSVRATRTGIRAISGPDPSLWITKSSIRVISDYFTDPNLSRFTRTGVRVISSFYGSGTKFITINAIIVEGAVQSGVPRIYWTF